jgi:hypothetical protein
MAIETGTGLAVWEYVVAVAAVCSPVVPPIVVEMMGRARVRGEKRANSETSRSSLRP